MINSPYKCFLSLGFLTLSLGLNLAPNLAAAQMSAPACATLQLPAPVVANLDFATANQRSYFAKLTDVIPRVPVALWKRYWNDAVTLEIQRNLLLDQSGKSAFYKIEGVGDLITRTLVIEDHLFLDLVHIRAMEDGNGLKVGQRAKGINTLFLKAMTAFLRSAVSVVEADPHITTIVIKGINLKNPMLIEFLVENGFTRNDIYMYSKEFERTVVLK